MQATHIWYQFPIHRCKVVVWLVLLLPLATQAQYKHVKRNNPEYDNRKITYGFMIGIHTSGYRSRYSDSFVTADQDTVHSVMARFSPGFSLGFLINLKLHEFLDFRLMPKVGFYDHELQYAYTNNDIQTQLVETAIVEFPLLLKYKSMRRGNVRMYMIGGVTPGFEVSGKNDVSTGSAELPIKKANLSLEAGLGFDLYFPLFKFSPEIRFARGITNMLGTGTGQFVDPIKQLTTNTISVYLIFQ
jgi:hypothetical protein